MGGTVFDWKKTAREKIRELAGADGCGKDAVEAVKLSKARAEVIR